MSSKSSSGVKRSASFPTSESTASAPKKILKTKSLHHFFKSTNTDSPGSKPDSARVEGGRVRDGLIRFSCYEFDENVKRMTFVDDDSDNRKLIKIAAFDLDNTLITTKSKRLFAKNEFDWKFMFPAATKTSNTSAVMASTRVDSVSTELHQLAASDEHCLVIFSNQLGIGQGKVQLDSWKNKIASVFAKLKLPILMFAATRKDTHRKPAVGMWDACLSHLTSLDVSVDTKASFFVGDAAGRIRNSTTGKKKDFSCSDRKFALNAGIGFHTPESFFLDQAEAEYELRSFDPFAALKWEPDSIRFSPLPDTASEVVLFFGRPAAGKSTFYRKHLSPLGFVHVNQDTLKTQKRCLSIYEEALQDRKSICIDNTNATRAVRQKYIELAVQYDVPIRCFVLKSSYELSVHLNHLRAVLCRHERPPLPDVVFRTFEKHVEYPLASEGFHSIEEITFSLDFDDDEHKRAFLTYF